MSVKRPLSFEYLGVRMNAGQVLRDLPALEMLERKLEMVELWRQAKISSRYILSVDIGALKTTKCC